MSTSLSVSTELQTFFFVLGIIVCQAGCILENIDNALSEKDLTVPVDIHSRGSCQIGGNVATNAGGIKLLRYGNMHANVLGVEVVSFLNRAFQYLVTKYQIVVKSRKLKNIKLSNINFLCLLCTGSKLYWSIGLNIIHLMYFINTVEFQLLEM